MSSIPQSVGRAPFGDYETWYQVSGDLGSSMAPLVVLHGGPGCSHDYLENLVALSESGRAVIHYDQIGGGRSTLLPDQGASFWKVGLFLAELENLLVYLGVNDSYHLLGQSWGGMLGAEHAVGVPSGLRSLIVSNSPASMALWASEAQVLRSKLDPEVARVLDEHEAAGTIRAPAYLQATQAYYDKHVCRVVPNPPELVRTIEFMSQDSTVYNLMNGPNEFHCVGTLKDRSIIDRLSNIDVPCCSLLVVMTKRRPQRCSRILRTYPMFAGRFLITPATCLLLRNESDFFQSSVTSWPNTIDQIGSRRL